MSTPFAKQLLGWHDPDLRDYPWKKTKDPYKIWVSEIILQQTRSEQALPFFNRFLAAFPTLAKLAQSKEDEVLKLWEGLGYYSRARNLHSAAQVVYKDLGGVIPSSYSELIKLRGIGPYTAAAISSFAFGESHPVFDGNVARVVSRYFGLYDSPKTSHGKRQLMSHLLSVFDHEHPASFNQAIMDLGAIVCRPKSPFCSLCPLKDQCIAFKLDIVNQLPVKSIKTPKRKRFFNYLHFEQNGSLLLQKRGNNDIWSGLYQFPLIESLDSITSNEIASQGMEDFGGLEGCTFQSVYKQSRVLSHQKIEVSFWKIHGIEGLKFDQKVYFWRPIKDLRKLAFPRVFGLYFKQIS